MTLRIVEPTVQRPQPPPGDPPVEVVWEDGDILVVNKPADLVCHPTKTDEYSSLIGRARLHLRATSESPPHLINRLDRETSGLVLIGKTPAAAREWRLCWEAGDVEKTYEAIVHGRVASEEAWVEAPLGKDLASAVAIKDAVRPDGLPARTHYRVIGRGEREGAPFTWLRVTPQTGKKHQIRIHLAHIGHPIVGDKIYGGDERVYLAFVEKRMSDEQRRWLILGNHALLAAELKAACGGRAWHFIAAPGSEFREFRDRVFVSAKP